MPDVPDAPDVSAKGSGVVEKSKGVLTRKIGPLPLIAWAGVGLGAFLVYRILTGKGGGSSTTPGSFNTGTLPDAGTAGGTIADAIPGPPGEPGPPGATGAAGPKGADAPITQPPVPTIPAVPPVRLPGWPGTPPLPGVNPGPPRVAPPAISIPHIRVPLPVGVSPSIPRIAPKPPISSPAAANDSRHFPINAPTTTRLPAVATWTGNWLRTHSGMRLATAKAAYNQTFGTKIATGGPNAAKAKTAAANVVPKVATAAPHPINTGPGPGK